VDEYREYRLLSGERPTIIGGYTDDDLVSSMAETKFRTPRSATSYRLATARRVRAQHGLDIDPTTNETFITSLREAELLVPVL
jgi:hypothetical protein